MGAPLRSTATRTPSGATAPPSRPARAAAAGRRLLRLQGPPGRLLPQRAPLAGEFATGRTNESTLAVPLIDKLRAGGFAVETCAMDKGYDTEALYAACEDRQVRPIMPLRLTPAVKTGADEPPSCEHGRWQFAGSDHNRKASKWRRPTGECKPASRWIKASRIHPLVPRDTDRWRKLYKRRASVEREFGRLKHKSSCCRFAFVALSASSFTPTSPSWRSSPAPSQGREPYGSRPRPPLNERLAPQESRAPLSLLPRRVARASAVFALWGPGLMAAGPVPQAYSSPGE